MVVVDYEKNTVTMPIDRYEKLIESEDRLRALQWAGVDNWDGYDFAMEIYNQND